MTIAIGFAYDDGLVFCADTKISGLSNKANGSKIEQYISNNGYCRAVFAMSAMDLDFPRALTLKCWESLQKLDFATCRFQDVRDKVDSYLADFYRKHIYKHPDREKGQIVFEFLIGIWLRNESHLYRSHETVMTPVSDGYDAIGAGEYLARYLIKQYRRANPGANSIRDAALIARHAVQEAIDYDEGCGGQPELLIIENNGNATSQLIGLGYPSNMFLDVFSDLKWKMVHDLANLRPEDQFSESADKQIDEFVRALRSLDTSSKFSF